MIRSNILTSVVLVFCLGIITATKVYLSPFSSPSSQTYFINPSQYLEYFTFGYNELVADLLWLRTIQDVDHCDHEIKDGEKCANSWVFKMVDKVTDLSPHFRIIYATVPLLLAISINDTQGAVQLQEKGLIHFPKDWPILYRGGYLYLYETENKEKAAELFVRAQQNGAPDWLASLANRLYTEVGRLELAEKIIKDFEEKGLDPALLKRMQDRMKGIKGN